MTIAFGESAPVVAFVGALTAALLVTVGTWWFGRRADSYSHMRHTISELGAAGTRDARSVAWLWFAPNAAAFALGACALGQALGWDDAGRASITLAAVGVGWIGAALFPCDPGAPTFGSARNYIHNVVGGAGYLAGTGGMFEMHRVLEDSYPLLATSAQVGGGIVMVGLFLISFSESPIRGLIQRMMEAALHGWLLVAALTVFLQR